MSESYYAIEKFAESERSLASIIEAIPGIYAGSR